MREKIKITHLILIHNPALELVVPALMGGPVLDDVVDGQVAQARALGQDLAVRCLADARGAGDDDVGPRASRHFFFFPSFFQVASKHPA